MRKFQQWRTCGPGENNNGRQEHLIRIRNWQKSKNFQHLQVFFLLLLFLVDMSDDIHLIRLLTSCAFEFILEANICKFLSNTNVHVSQEKAIELQETILISFFEIFFDLAKHKISSYGQLDLVGKISTQPYVNAIDIKHFKWL